MIRYILTGAPGAGKTAVPRLLECNGATVVEEAATDVIALENARGHREPWHDQRFIDKIVTLQRQRQRQARAQATEAAAVFFDRSPVCTLALSRYLGFRTITLAGGRGRGSRGRQRLRVDGLLCLQPRLDPGDRGKADQFRGLPRL